jgi:hypothetical protein
MLPTQRQLLSTRNSVFLSRTQRSVAEYRTATRRLVQMGTNQLSQSEGARCQPSAPRRCLLAVRMAVYLSAPEACNSAPRSTLSTK